MASMFPLKIARN